MIIKVKADGFVSFEKMLDVKVCYAVRISGKEHCYLCCEDAVDDFWGLCNSNIETCGLDRCTKFLCMRSAESFATKVRKMFQEYGNDHLKKKEIEVVVCGLSYYWREREYGESAIKGKDDR